MIYVDPREGSGPLAPILGTMGMPVTPLMLDFGDVAYDIEGPEGVPIPCGWEVKTPADAMACITTKRFCGHQLPGMHRKYQVRYLAIEGPFMRGPDGLVYVPPYKDARPERWIPHASRTVHSHFMEWLTGIEVRAGFKLRFTQSREDTAAHIFAAYVVGRKDWDAHDSFNVIYEHEGNGISFKPIELRRRFAALLPGIGWKKSEAVAAMFPTIGAMVNAQPEQWAQVEYGKAAVGRKRPQFSMQTAKEIVKAIWG